MRTYLGYITIFFLLPVLSIFIFLSYQEWSRFETPHHVLDERIPLDQVALSETSYITAGNGKVISEIPNEENRVYLDIKEIPVFLEDLFIITEDQKFYQHRGIDVTAISRALLVNSRKSEIAQGGSTITQQLVRNVFLTHDKTYNRKLSELFYAYQLERKHAKPEIIELYLNAIYFNNGAYGIEAASRFYFSKSTKDLSKAEIAFLAAIPNNPELYDPLTHFDHTKKRQERILKQMVVQGKLTKRECDTLTHKKIRLNLSNSIDLYPDYVTYVHHELRDLVAKSSGLSQSLKSKDTGTKKQAEIQLNKQVTTLLKSGVTIHTALDIGLQTRAKTALQTQIRTQDIEGASVVIQHHTHQLVSLIGGKEYKKNSFHRAYQSYRQPGSAIKPLLDYAPYIEETGAELNQLVSGASYCSNSYCPRNYNGATYGMIPIKQAFAQSYNTPAIRLFEKTGIKESFEYLDRFHFKKVSIQDHHISSAIGGFKYGMSPLELTNAYTSFVDGSYQPARAITKITDRQGNTLYKWNDHTQKVWSKETVSKMRQLLHEVTINGTARRAFFQTGYIGGKTGTTNDAKDIWFVGLTGNYTTGVWVGKDKPASLQAVYSRQPQISIWKTINQAAENQN